MDVFVIPVGGDRYELYYEQASEVAVEIGDEPPPSGMFARLQRRFSELLRAAEEQRNQDREQSQASQSWSARMQDRMMAWIAKRIAEQRLLWNLRKQEHAVAVHPSNMAFEAVMPHVQRALQRDFERHRIWLVVDT